MRTLAVLALALLVNPAFSPLGAQPPPNLATIDIESISQQVNENGDLIISFDIYGAANAGYDTFLFVRADEEPYSVNWASADQVAFEIDNANAQGKATISFTVPATNLPAATYGYAWWAEVWHGTGGVADNAYGYASK